MWYTPSGQGYDYGQTYPSTYDSSKSWSPVDMNTVDYNNPPDPTSYMYGEQFGDCFVREDRGMFSKLLRWVFCLG